MLNCVHHVIPQVMDEGEGWGEFRVGYGSENRKFLAASFPGTPWILASATLDDEAIVNIASSLGTSRWTLQNETKNLLGLKKFWHYDACQIQGLLQGIAYES